MSDKPRASGRPFKAGVSGNPNGRPRGTCSDRTLRNIELHNEAAEYMPRWIEIVKQLCEEKHEWAIKTFGDKFVKRPENDGYKKIHIKDLATASTAEQIQSLIAKTPEFGELTLKEFQEYLKVLSGIKANEVAESADNTNKVAHETLLKRLALLDSAIEFDTANDPKEV